LLQTIITNITILTIMIESKMPQVPLRVHIVPVGFEIDRIVIPAKKMRAEKVIMIANESLEDKATMFYDRVEEEFKNAGISTETERKPFFSLKDNIELFSDLIKRYKDQYIFINISSGSKIQALAAFISVMAAKSQGIEVSTYYVEPEKYTDDPPKGPISQGCKNILELPIFPLYTPSREIQYSVALLKRRSYYKLELAIQLAKAGIFNKELIDIDRGIPRDEKARITLQNSVENRVIQPMLKDKYATTEKIGRKVKITLTKFGEDASNLFLKYD